MAIRDLPTTEAFRAIVPFSHGLQTSESSFSGFYTGNRETVSHAADKMLINLTFPPCSASDARDRSAFWFDVKSTGDWVRFALPHRRYNRGTLSGSPTLNGSVSAGARSVTLTNGRAGQNLLRRADLYSTYGTSGWQTLNCTITGGQIDPWGVAAAQLMTRTATGNHGAWQTMTTTAHAGKTVACRVWLKRGTLSGNVTLRLRDGAGTEAASVSLAITTSWALYEVDGAFGGSPAANIQFHVDPDNNAGSAGDTLYISTAQIEVLAGTYGNAGLVTVIGTDPDGGSYATEFRRTATGACYWFDSVTSSVAAGDTFTFSVWLKRGTLTGNIGLDIENASAVSQAFATVSPTASWARYTVSGAFSAPSASVLAVIFPANTGGSAGDSLQVYGAQLEVGGGTTPYTLFATALAGDFISIGGNLLETAYAGATADYAGAITLPLVLPVQKAHTSGTVATTTGATGVWELDDAGMQFDYSAAMMQTGFSLPFRQRIV